MINEMFLKTVPSEKTIDQVSRINHLMRTDTSPPRQLYSIFHHEGLESA